MKKFTVKSTNSPDAYNLDPMVMDDILRDIIEERNYQEGRWGEEFDVKNTYNDWASYINRYLEKTTRSPFSPSDYRKNMIKVAALAIASLEILAKHKEIARPHYDKK